MREFFDENGGAWFASAREERTPRHHGRWYLVFQRAGDNEALLPMPEVRWQTRATAERTLRTMSEFELRRRLTVVQARAGVSPRPGGDQLEGGPDVGGWPPGATAGGERSTAAVSGSESSGPESAGED